MRPLNVVAICGIAVGVSTMAIAWIIEPTGYVLPTHMLIGFTGGMLLMFGIGVLVGGEES